jgi:hypothetical protein
MTILNYSLDQSEYTLKNALLWGVFLGHCKKTQNGSLSDRCVHLMIAAAEFLPFASQITSLTERYITSYYFKPSEDLSEKKITVLSNPKTPVSPEIIETPLPTISTFAKLETLYKKIETTLHIRVNSSPNFELMFDLYIKLYEGSKTYREVVNSIEKRKNQPVTLMDRETAVQTLKFIGEQSQAEALENFSFQACWQETLNAVVIMEPAELDESVLGSLLAFEMTNGYQQERFTEVQAKANNDEFNDRHILNDSNRIERASLQYAFANENIENEGRTIHDKIISEAMAAGKATSAWHWGGGNSTPAHIRFHQDLILSEYGQKHIAYYQDYYNNTIEPYLRSRRKVQMKDRVVKNSITKTC